MPTQRAVSPEVSAAAVRRQFLDFFCKKHGHAFAPSSPVVPHDDPTLLFTNAGMNQFKPLFLGQADPNSELGRLQRAANSQKCIRAGGKHNDLDDVGKDLYHHTFFEMLGNWSFGDYFKAEAIDWAWELFTKVWGLDPERLYATYFQGDEREGLEPDHEARDLWRKHLPPDRVLPGDMKDNFWEMGDTGPCGPCSEIHYDGRPDAGLSDTPGRALVNTGDPDVIELWNLVFIQFDRSAQGLKPLPARHVDTGMGLERICRVLQGKTSNYDTDLFTPLFEKIQEITGAAPYSGSLDKPADIAYRVIADHARALSFAITDGADPSNEGRGYVLRRILRRAVRHGRQTLGAEGPFLCDLVPTIVEEMGEFFPELKKNPKRVMGVIREEEEAFGRTLDQGLMTWWSFAGYALQSQFAEERVHDSATHRTIMNIGGTGTSQEYEFYQSSGLLPFKPTSRVRIHRIATVPEAESQSVEEFRLQDVSRELIQRLFRQAPVINAHGAFKLHDTYGFPIDLTQIMAEERGLTVDVAGFERLMEEAREKSRAGAGKGEGAHPAANLPADAVASLQKLNIKTTDDAPKFESLRLGATVRAIWNGSDFDENIDAAETRPADRFAIITDRTCFYPEMGGQVGDTGRMRVTRENRANERHVGDPGEFLVEDTRMVAGFVLHIGRMRAEEIRVGDIVELRVDTPRRAAIARNHTATHLLNHALREALGEGVEQKGSLVAPDRLRFDFSASGPLGLDAGARVERAVRDAIERDLPVYAQTQPLADAKKIRGLRAVFGEAYPDPVRVVSIGAPIDELIKTPQNKEWLRYSVEFCGGTHLSRTGETGAFALTEEEGVAKGVRRVVALTGQAAGDAIESAAQLLARAQEASGLDGDALAGAVGGLQSALEQRTLPLVDRAALRGELERLQERLKQARKQAAAAGREGAVEAARALSAASPGAPIVAVVPAGGERDALLAAMDAVRARNEASPVLLLSPDEQAGKITIAASCPKGAIDKGLKAGDWVRETAAACGGKGGGRPDSAQGGGTDLTKLDDAVAAAKAFAGERV